MGFIRRIPRPVTIGSEFPCNIKITVMVENNMTYPSRALRFVVPYAKNGPGDILARLIGAELSQRLGQPVEFENLPGAGGTLGTAAVAKAPADGYTLLLMASPHTINPSLYKSLPYDTLGDFEPVTLVITMPNVLVVNPSFPVSDVKGLVEHAASHPGQLKYGSSGVGTPSHLGAELLKTMTGVDIRHVQFSGHAAAGEALRNGEVHLLFDAMLLALPETRAGKFKALGVTSAKRSALAPDIPTIDESGLPGFDFSPGVGVLVKSATPPEIVTRLYQEIRAILNAPDVAKRLSADGAQIVASEPRDFGQYIREEIAKWAKVVKAAGITVG